MNLFSYFICHFEHYCIKRWVRNRLFFKKYGMLWKWQCDCSRIVCSGYLMTTAVITLTKSWGTSDSPDFGGQKGLSRQQKLRNRPTTCSRPPAPNPCSYMSSFLCLWTNTFFIMKVTTLHFVIQYVLPHITGGFCLADSVFGKY